MTASPHDATAADLRRLRRHLLDSGLNIQEQARYARLLLVEREGLAQRPTSRASRSHPA
jgi:hypothetical protein